MAILEAGQWIDASLQNKLKMAETVADKAYVNTSVDAINQRILGRYVNGLGKSWDDPNHMKFYNGGAVSFPYLSDGMWFLTQHKRWGLLKDHPDYLAVAKQINQIDIYKQAASAINAALQGMSYRPDADFYGSATLSVQVSDGQAAQTSQVSLTISGTTDGVADQVTEADLKQEKALDGELKKVLAKL